MKKFLCLLLSSMMILSICTPVFATSSNKNQIVSSGDIYICEEADGLFRTAKNKRANNTIKVTQYEQFDNIFLESSQKQYYQKINEDEFIKVSKLDFALADYKSCTDIQKYSIPDEVLDGIEKMAAWAEETNNQNARGAVFVPSINSRDDNLNTIPPTTTTWNGMTFHNYQVYFTNLNTGWQTIHEGANVTENILSAFTDVAVTVSGMVSGTVGLITSIFGIGMSCLDAWVNSTGKVPIYGDPNDKVMANITGNLYLKYTYYYHPALQRDILGCSTQLTYIQTVETDTFLYTSTGGERKQTIDYVYDVFRTPNYDHPEEKAFNFHSSCWIEQIACDVQGVDMYLPFKIFTFPSDWPQ